LKLSSEPTSHAQNNAFRILSVFALSRGGTLSFPLLDDV
jgi:hypothetical protein